MRHETNSLSCMEIWNSKSGGNIYSEFEDRFEILLEVHFRHTIYRFEAHELKSLML